MYTVKRTERIPEAEELTGDLISNKKEGRDHLNREDITTKSPHQTQ